MNPPREVVLISRLAWSRAMVLERLHYVVNVLLFGLPLFYEWRVPVPDLMPFLTHDDLPTSPHTSPANPNKTVKPFWNKFVLEWKIMVGINIAFLL
jgi:hypothetical protein